MADSGGLLAKRLRGIEVVEQVARCLQICLADVGLSEEGSELQKVKLALTWLRVQQGYPRDHFKTILWYWH